METTGWRSRSSQDRSVFPEESSMKTTLALALMGAALISMPAVAQNSASQNSASQNSVAQGQSSTQQEAKAPPLYQIKPGEWRASKLDGLDVYNTNNEKIGDISELIVDRSGKIQAVVIGIGGFLGMGEHQVAVPFEQVQWVDQPVEHRTSSNDRNNAGNGTGGNGTSGSGTSGSGSSMPAASGSAASGTNADRDRDAGTTAANAPPPEPAQVNAPIAGTQPVPAPANGPAAINGPAGGAATATVAPTQTRTDPSTGAMVTTTGGGNATAMGGDRSTTTGSERSGTTDGGNGTALGRDNATAAGGDRTNASDRTANRDSNWNDTTRMYRPDHAVVAMTKDQLKALPEVRYSR
jgi:sporulation protein YlmC with PRC-barrel domain